MISGRNTAIAALRDGSRPGLHRRGRRVLSRLLARTRGVPRRAVEPAVRRFLRARSFGFLARVVRDRAFALAVVALLASGGTAAALPPVELSDVSAGLGGFVINGVDFHDQSGGSVCGAGDVNGDGLDDVILGAISAEPATDWGVGQSYVVFGKADGTPVNLSAVSAGIGGFVLNGIDAYDGSGVSVSGAGDVNGDGFDDLIVGAVGADAGGSVFAGESYVIFGKADGAAVNLSDVAAGNGGFVINGAAPGDRSGISVCGAGDVDGDGLDDVIVGAYSADPGGNNFAGASYVVFGKAGGAPVELAAVGAGSGGFVINGIDPSDRSGISVCGAGDVNGDGLEDVVVGAYLADPGGNASAGESYVVFGKADGMPVSLSSVTAGAGGFAIHGIDSEDRSGRSVSGAGDVNGDGLDDVIVGAPGAAPSGNSGAGESYVVFGKTDGMLVHLAAVAAGKGGFAISGIDPSDTSGSSVSSAGDVNGDGLADVIVGAYGADPGGRDDAGESYLVFGKADGAPVSLAAVAAGDGGFVISGIDPLDYSGRSVAGAGDVDGDGLDDLVVGAPLADPAGNDAVGETYVVWSPACRWDCDGGDDRIVSVADLLALLAQYDPMSPGDCAGGSCDFNDDGCVDVADLLKLLGHYDPAGTGCP